MSEYTIFHNPRCSKSRQTLALLEENGISPEIVLYLENTPSADVLANVVEKLGVTVRDIMRIKEDAYKDNGFADASLSDQALFDKLVEFPKVIERPIVVKGDKAVIGRPPENALALING